LKRKQALAAAASLTALALLTTPVQAQRSKLPLDANGMPCRGVLDGAHQCITPEEATSTPEHPYRPAGQSDPRLQDPVRGFNGGPKELLYAAVPGSIVVLDVKNNYDFVKRIPFEWEPAPISPESISAMMTDPVTNMVYVSTRGHLVAIDLLTERVVWSKAYEPGTCCERGEVTPDGLHLVVGSDLKDFHRVINARTGEVERIIPTPLSMYNHNMNLSADGKVDFAAPNGVTMTIADVDTGKTIKTITFPDHIRVFVINHDGSKIYANLNNLMGFAIADVKSGKVEKIVEEPGEMWKAKWADANRVFYGHGAPMHGIALTPDDCEVWIPDAINNQVLVYDNDGPEPTLDLTKSFKTNGAPNGWITMGLDGERAYMASGDVIDVKTHKVIAQVRDEYGRHMDSEKMQDIQFDGRGHVARVEDQFSVGVPAAYAARQARARRTGGTGCS